MLLTTLKNQLSSARYDYKFALQNKKGIMQRIAKYKELGLFIGDDKERLTSNLGYYMNDIKIYRSQALNFAKQISLYNMLTDGQEMLTAPKYDIEKIALTVENDFYSADEILESGDVTSHYADSQSYYNDRVEHSFNGSYPVKIERVDDYYNFIQVLIDDMIVMETSVNFSVSFEEWKTGYKVEGKRQTKLNKYLRKQGFSQYTIDYYSQQVRTEKTLYITVSDRVQHITGMSYYSNMEWTGVSGSSCQDPRNEYDDCLRLLPSLHDNKLVIAFLHENLEDLEDLDEKMLGRTMCRIVHVEGKQFLVGSKLYGSMETIDELDKGMKQLNEFGIFAGSQMDRGSIRHEERTNGQFELTHEEEVHIDNEYEEEVSCDCPACNGSGDLTVWTSNDREVEVKCPACGGSGEYYTYATAYISEYVTVTETDELEPYNEGYQHYGHKTVIGLDYGVLGL